MKQLAIVLALFLLTQTGANKIKELNPDSTKTLKFNARMVRKYNDEIRKAKSITEKIGNKKWDDYTKEEEKASIFLDRNKNDFFDIFGIGCNWYCGGGPKKVTASSHLKQQGKITYRPENAHDLNYKNVWAEGVKGYGIGEYLLYTFEPIAPRITRIIVVNGHVKSEKAWKNNSRVKKLKLYIDDKPYAILKLEDIRGEQTFNVNPIGNDDRNNFDNLKLKPDWTLKFEIMEVYKGLKYDDVVISEIYFDGIDVHCFAKGTKIKMADGSEKNIEELCIGDDIATVDLVNSEIKTSKIEKLEKVIHYGLVTYTFESGLKITSTKDHPFMVINKGWSSLKPEQSKQYKSFEYISKIEIGDLFQSLANENQLKTDKLIKIESSEKEEETFTISKLSSGENFIANGFIVGVEEL